MWRRSKIPGRRSKRGGGVMSPNSPFLSTDFDTVNIEITEINPPALYLPYRYP